MNLLLQLLTGGVMLCVTVMIHAMALDYIIRHTGNGEKFLRRHKLHAWKPVAACVVVLAVFVSHVIQIWLWAGLYLQLSCAPLTNLSDALYFATVTYTTLGYGNITLENSCRMLSGIEAANGFIVFGWTTAFIFEVISQLYRRESKTL